MTEKNPFPPSRQDKALCHALRYYRLLSGYSQNNIAVALGMRRPTYTYCETGVTMPEIRILYLLSLLYSIPVSAFLQFSSDSHICSQKRPPKKYLASPTKICHLKEHEKSLIAVLRLATARYHCHYSREIINYLQSLPPVQNE